MPYTRVVRSGSQVEVYEYANEPADHSGQVRKRRKRIVGEDDLPLVPRRADNIHRLARDFRRLVWANLDGIENPAFITLTMFKIVGIEEARHALNLFTGRVRKNICSDFRFIAVVEYQKRGAPHFHVLIWGLPPALIANERHDRYLQHLWQAGYLDCIPTDGSPKLAGYLAKYMSKSMSDDRLLGKKSYTTSRNLMRPLLHRFTEIFDNRAPAYLDSNHELIQTKTFNTDWLGKATYRLYLDPKSPLKSYPPKPDLSPELSPS